MTVEVTIKLDENGFSVSSPEQLSHLELLGFLAVANDATIQSLKQMDVQMALVEEEKEEPKEAEVLEFKKRKE